MPYPSPTPPDITPAYNLTVTPVNASGASQQFTANVVGPGNLSVTWTVSSGHGSITSNGLYTENAEHTEPATIRATSVEDPTLFGKTTYFPV